MRILRLGLPLALELDGALSWAALFLSIVGFYWPTRGGRQCWNSGFR
jgi:hypothetical protein